LNIGKYCTRNVITTDLDSSVIEAAKLMRKYHVGSLVVVSRDADGLRPIGILTDRDIVIEVLAEEVTMESVTVEDIMTRSPIVAREDDDIFMTMETMRVKGVRRLPVTDSLGILVGILTTDDLLGVIYEEMGNIVSLFSREQLQEYRKHTG